ncbi:MAG: cystathionine beta-lyase [Rhodospirillaceae bacterium]|nr:cystathionine beta-lyase [Rhodospirillaceae bacterium]
MLAHAGNHPREHKGVVNPPVYHASTILFPTVAALEEAIQDRFRGVSYGRYGTPTTFALEEAVAALEGSAHAITLPSGLAAITMAVMTFAKPGDHVLVADNVYDPVRGFCERILKSYGIEVTYFDSSIGKDVAELFTDKTRILYLETPGSLSFEMPDVAALAAPARERGILVMVDNTWATGLHFKPLAHGADLSIYAATKYITGHSDVMMGMIVCGTEHYRPIKMFAHGLGMAVAPDDCYLALRGLRTLSVRLDRHKASSLAVATWLEGRPEVARVMHPALPHDPGHAIWQRDFTGAGGLFGAVLHPVDKPALAAMLDGLSLFGMGFSWGGYESLILPVDPAKSRTATRWAELGPTVRLHVGLEDPADLIADLSLGFERMRAAAAR